MVAYGGRLWLMMVVIVVVGCGGRLIVVVGNSGGVLQFGVDYGDCGG